MKTENKLGLYAVLIVLLAGLGVFTFVYSLDYKGNDIDLVLAFGLKAVGIFILYISSKLYQKHFKTI